MFKKLWSKMYSIDIFIDTVLIYFGKIEGGNKNVGG